MAQDVDAIRDAPSEGVYVHGLFLDGCAWSAKENRLVDAEPKKLFHPLPVLYITAVLVRRALCVCILCTDDRAGSVRLMPARVAQPCIKIICPKISSSLPSVVCRYGGRITPS